MEKYPLKFTEFFNRVTTTVAEQISSNKEQNGMMQKKILEFINISNQTIQERNRLNTVCVQIVEKEKDLLKMFAQIPGMIATTNQKELEMIDKLETSNEKSLQLIEQIPSNLISIQKRP
jgi:hypothetical protein